VLPAITRGDRKLRANRGEDRERGKSRFERLLEEPSPAEAEASAPDEPSTAWDAVPWNGSSGDSPIGDLLIRSFRTDPTDPAENGSARRNGKSAGGSTRRSEETDTSSGWMPKLDADRAGDEESRTRRRGRSGDTDRRRSRRAREERDDTASAPSRHSEPTQRRSRHGDDESADGADARTARGRHGRSGSLDGSEDGDRDRSGSTRGGGARRREEPAAVDLWTPESDFQGSDSKSSDLRGSDRHGEPIAAPTSSSASDESDGWLQSALAELDRALSGIGVSGPARIDEPAASDDGCAVVIDIARDGRRFAGRRAAAVVRSVADLLADRLPTGARSQFADSDALVVTRAGWSRPDATDWMHRTLPGLLDGFLASEELPGAQLRVAVHDADGPVGAQLLQPLTPAGRERGTEDPSAVVTATVSEVRGQKFRAARAGRPERGTGPLGERHSDPAGVTAPVASAGWPFSGDDPEPDPAPLTADDAPRSDEAGERGRRHRSDTQERARGAQEPVKAGGSGRAARRRTADAPSSTGVNGTGSNGTASNGTSSNGNGAASNGNGAANGNGAGSGRRTKRAEASDTAPAERAPEQVAVSAKGQEGAGREPDRAESTEGLGIADLLAGALAAYRGI
jgi:hypothetical protein